MDLLSFLIDTVSFHPSTQSYTYGITHLLPNAKSKCKEQVLFAESILQTTVNTIAIIIEACSYHITNIKLFLLNTP